MSGLSAATVVSIRLPRAFPSVRQPPGGICCRFARDCIAQNSSGPFHAWGRSPNTSLRVRRGALAGGGLLGLTFAVRRSTRRLARRAEREEEAEEPIDEFQDLRNAPLGSWGFLDSEEFAKRIAGVFAVALVPSLVLVTNIFSPTSDATGELLIRNVAADVLFGSFCSFVLLSGVMLRLAFLWDNANRRLRQRSFVIERDPVEAGISSSMGYYTTLKTKSKKDARRDNLIAEYETEPILSRMRAYLLGAIVLSGVSYAAGSAVGGEIRLADSAPEVVKATSDDDIGKSFGDIGRCKAGCLPGAGYGGYYY